MSGRSKKHKPLLDAGKPFNRNLRRSYNQLREILESHVLLDVDDV